VAGPLLVADEDVVELLRPVDRVVQRQDSTAGKSEDHVRSKLFERSDDSLGAVDALGPTAASGGGDGGGTGV
jgi:hypothetical protein